jgi:hypothetical protein
MERYIPLNPDVSAITQKIKEQIITVASNFIEKAINEEQANQAIKGLTALYQIECQQAIENVFEKFICPKLIFEQTLTEIRERKKKYTPIEAAGCVRAIMHDCGSVMTQEQKKRFIDAVIKNIRTE